MTTVFDGVALRLLDSVVEGSLAGHTPLNLIPRGIVRTAATQRETLIKKFEAGFTGSLGKAAVVDKEHRRAGLQHLDIEI